MRIILAFTLQRGSRRVKSLERVMVFGALRSIIRPVSRHLLSARPTLAVSPVTFPSPTPLIRWSIPWIPASNAFHSLTDTRYPKRRPSLTSRRKRASLNPPGKYVYVRKVPSEQVKVSNPNEGSVKRRNEKKRMKQRMSFIMSEKRKRKASVQEAKRKKNIEKVERKMAAVARERAWVERLAELEAAKAKKNAAMSSSV